MSLVRTTLDHRLAVDEVLSLVAREVSGYPHVVMRHMLPVLSQAEKELARGLARFLEHNQEGKFTAQRYRNALVQVEQALATARSLDPVLYGELVKQRPALGRAAVGHVRRELEIFSEHFEGMVRPIALDASAIIAVGEKTAEARFGTIAAKLGRDAEQHIRQQLALGVVRGESMDELKRRLVAAITTEDQRQRILGDSAQVGRMASDIIMRRVGNWADRVVRTEVLNAYNVIADDAIGAAKKIDPEIRRMWNAAEDRRTCPQCASLDGEVRDVDQKFPGGVDSPPAHPYCRCIVTSWRADWKL